MKDEEVGRGSQAIRICGHKEYEISSEKVCSGNKNNMKMKYENMKRKAEDFVIMYEDEKWRGLHVENHQKK